MENNTSQDNIEKVVFAYILFSEDEFTFGTGERRKRNENGGGRK